MKKLMLALAAACAIGFSAVAEPWFDGGIAEGWPTAGEGLAGGSWTNTDGCAWKDGVVDIKSDSDPDLALTFNATNTQDLANNKVTINTSFTFTPYSYNIEKGIDTRPGIPEGAKAGIILVSTNDVGEVTSEEDCTYWYVAYDEAGGTNTWTSSGVFATTADNKPITVTLQKGTKDGFYAVAYNIEGTIKDAVVKADDATIGSVVCAGTGIMSALNASVDAIASYTLTIGSDLENMSVTNVTGKGVTKVSDTEYTIPGGTTVTLYLAPAKDYRLSKETVVYENVAGSFTFDADEAAAQDVTATEIIKATLTFVASDEDGTTKKYEGEKDTKFTKQEELNEWANGEDVQWPGYWFDGTWYDNSECEGDPIDLDNLLYANASYYANATAVTYTVTYDMGGVAATHENPTTYTVDDDSFDLKAATPEDPSYTFQRWKDADGNTVVSIDTETCADITVYAEFSGEPPAVNVSMYFYDYGYDSGFEEDHLIYTEEGVEGAAWTQDALLEAANDPENQPTGKWFDGTWTDTDRVATELPEVIVKDAKFVMSVTNITYYIRQDFDGGEGEEDPTYEIKEEESQEITLVEPTKTGATFKAWEVVGDLPEGISIDGATITIDANAIGDVNVKATWEAEGPTPAAGSDTKVTPVAGEENTYKLEPTGTSTEVAVDNVKSGDTLVVDATVTAIGVQEGEQSGVNIKVRNSGDTAYIPNEAMYGWDGNSFGTALNPDAEVTVGEETIPVTPAVDATAETPVEVTDTQTSVATRTIPGLTYQLIRGTEVGSIETPLTTEGAVKTATGAATTLVDTAKPADKAFYQIKVTK